MDKQVIMSLSAMPWYRGTIWGGLHKGHGKYLWLATKSNETARAAEQVDARGPDPRIERLEKQVSGIFCFQSY